MIGWPTRGVPADDRLKVHVRFKDAPDPKVIAAEIQAALARRGEIPFATGGVIPKAGARLIGEGGPEWVRVAS